MEAAVEPQLSARILRAFVGIEEAIQGVEKGAALRYCLVNSHSLVAVWSELISVLRCRRYWRSQQPTLLTTEDYACAMMLLTRSGSLQEAFLWQVRLLC